MPIPTVVPKRLVDKIEVGEDHPGLEGPCWVWTRCVDKDGYPCTKWKIRGQWKKVRVYRVLYELLIGCIPKGKELDHLCRVRACCNPAHFEVVTHSENMYRMNQVKWMSPEKAQAVLRDVFENQLPLGQVADRHGLHKGNVAWLIRNVDYEGPPPTERSDAVPF